MEAIDYTAVIGMGDVTIQDDDDYLYPRRIKHLAYEVEDPHRTLNTGDDGVTSSTGYPNNSDNRVDYTFDLKTIDEHGMCAFSFYVVIEYAANVLVTNGELLDDVEELSDHLGVDEILSIGENLNGAFSNLVNDVDSCNTFSRTASASSDGANIESVIVGHLFLIPLLLAL